MSSHLESQSIVSLGLGDTNFNNFNTKFAKKFTMTISGMSSNGPQKKLAAINVKQFNMKKLNKLVDSEQPVYQPEEQFAKMKKRHSMTTKTQTFFFKRGGGAAKRGV